VKTNKDRHILLAVHIFGRESSFLMSNFVSTFPQHDRKILGQIQEDRFSTLKELVSITNFICIHQVSRPYAG